MTSETAQNRAPDTALDVAGKKVTVVGMGRTALALAELLVREGAEPFITEAGPAERFDEPARRLDALGVAWEAGGHTEAALEGAGLVIPSPGVPFRSHLLEAARERGLPIQSELEFSWRFCPCPILAVTGTNGKTTTTELLAHLIRGCGHAAALAGNNATPMSAAVAEAGRAATPPAYLVAEVSSYQLEGAGAFRPWLAAVLNLTPDHLERHGSLQAYAEAKARIFRNQGEGDAAVVNADDPMVARMASPAGARRIAFSGRGRRDEGLWLEGGTLGFGDSLLAEGLAHRLPGAHNAENVAAAFAMLYAGGFDLERAKAALADFRAVEHRLEPVAEIGDAAYINDSKATNIHSLVVALESFSQPVILIAGGRGKGADYAVLRRLVQQKVRMLIAIGEDAPLLEAALGEAVPCVRAESLEAAVAAARTAAKPGWAVLLSPACASFDMFANFEERGRAFKEIVRRFAGEDH